MKNKVLHTLGAAALSLPTLALAHTGAADGHAHVRFFDGLLHPVTGADHLAAMLAVGAWSALALRPPWAAPLAFVALLLAGALAGLSGLSGFHLPAVEPMIAASLLVIGLLMATRARLPVALAAALVGGFALFHGVAHGAELAGEGAAAALGGMVLGTAVLHVAGIGIGQAVLARQRWLRAASGAAVAALGSVMLLRLAA